MGKPQEKTREQRIKAETNRLMRIFKTLDQNKLQTVKTLICRVAFATVSLQELERELTENGWVEEYQHGDNQRGIKQSANASVYISLSKNLNAMVKQLADMVPAAQRKSKLEELMRK